MNPPGDKILCLAHETDSAPRNSRTPPAFCDRLAACVRHQAITQAPYDGSHAVQPRVCASGRHDAFIGRDAGDSEGGDTE